MALDDFRPWLSFPFCDDFRHVPELRPAAPVLTLDQAQDSLYMRKKCIAGFVTIGPDLRDDRRFVKFV